MINKIKQQLILFDLIAMCFNAYALFHIGSFPITLSVCITSLILIIGVAECLSGKKIPIVPFSAYLGIIILLILSSFFSKYDVDYTSSLLYLFLFSSFLFSAYQIDRKRFFLGLKFVVFIYTVLSFYGIYQFFAYMYNLPLQDFFLKGHMVGGFNTTNLVELGHFSFYRAHSIYLEPSFLSKFAAIAIVLSLVLYKQRYIEKINLVCRIIINFCALIVSVAGTGILLLVICFFVFLIKVIGKPKSNRAKLGLLFSVMLAALSLILIFCSDWVIFVYIRTRLGEIFDPSLSGGMRFTSPYLITIFSAFRFPFGCGAGNEGFIIEEYAAAMQTPATYETFASGYAKIGCELGLFGLFLFVVLLWTVKKKNNDILYLFVILLSINFLGGNLLQTDFWCWAFLLNFSEIGKLHGATVIKEKE